MNVRVSAITELLMTNGVPCPLFKEISGIVEEACSHSVFKKELRRRICKGFLDVTCAERGIIDVNVPLEPFLGTFNEVENVECECGETEKAYISKIVMENSRYTMLKSEKALEVFEKVLRKVFNLAVEDIVSPKVRMLKRTSPTKSNLRFTSFVLPLYGFNLVAHRDTGRIEELVDLMIGLRGGYMTPSPRKGTYYPLGVVTYSSLLCSSLTLLDELGKGKLISNRLDVWNKMRIRSCLKCMIRKRFNIIYSDVLTLDENYKGFKKLVFYLCAEFVKVAQPNAWEG